MADIEQEISMLKDADYLNEKRFVEQGLRNSMAKFEGPLVFYRKLSEHGSWNLSVIRSVKNLRSIGLIRLSCWLKKQRLGMESHS